MTRTFLSLFIIALSVHFVCAGSAYGQMLKEKHLFLSVNKETLKEVFTQLAKQSGYHFFYDESVLDMTKQVSIKMEDESIDHILKEISRQTGLQFKKTDHTISVAQERVVVPESMTASEEKKTVTGVVLDEEGYPVIGANVIEKGTTNGIVTDFDGKFSIQVEEDAVLQISYIGYADQEIPVSGKTTFSISMREDTQLLEEVVVVGYGVQKKVNLTGAVASVKGDDIVKRPVTNVESMLQGKMPGVQIVQNSGEPGNESVSIRIRGTGTFSSAGSDPLVLVDGVQGNLSDLNPNDIESISVLKDAASASIYGARAANGVILVTTKKGEAGKISMNYRGNFAIHTPTKLFDLVTNSVEYMELFNEARLNSGLSSGLYTDEIIDAYRNATDRNQYPNTDWLDLLFSPAPTQTHNLSFSGGNHATTFNVSLGYVNQEGVMKGFDYEKYNIRLNVSSQVNKNIRFGGNFSLKKGIKSAPRQGAGDTFLAGMSQAPTYSPQLADGSGRYTFKAYDFEYNNKSPIAIIENKVNRNTNDYVIAAQGWLDVQLLKGVKWYTKGAINLNFNKYSDFRPQVPLYNFHTHEFMSYLDVGGSGLEVQNEQTEYKNLYTYLNFEHSFEGGHNLMAQAGYSVEENIYQYLKGYRKNYPKDDLRELDAGSPSVQQANGNTEEWALMAFFGRLGYNYQNRYLLEANLRYDGTSRLAAGNRWGAFPSFSAGWRLSEEQFFKNLNAVWINSVKLRGSYGQLGNQNIGLYPYQAILDLTGNYSFDDTSLSSGVAQNQLSNTAIKWETTSITDFGFDLTAFDGLTITFDWYKKKTTDILRNSQVTDVVGLRPPVVNNGTMENTGIELDLQYLNRIRSGIFSGMNYRVGFNIDCYKNKLVDFGEREISGYSLREESREWDAFYMLEWIGIFQSEEDIANSPKQFNDATVPGDLKFKDQLTIDTDGDGVPDKADGVINNDDRTVLSGKYPAFNYSMNFSANWKGFDLSAQFQGVEGVKYFVNEWGTIPFVQGSPPTTDWRNRWTEPNPSTTMPRIYWGWSAPERIRRNSSWYLQDGSYLRIKNLTVGYTLPKTVFDRIGVEQFRIYFSGDNLFTITNYPGLDPERGESGRFVNYPQNKIYSIGLNVNF